MVTSSAVVGSSAIRSFGRQASAMAIITRWFMPPESWCGNAFSRRSASGMPTAERRSIARLPALLAVESEMRLQSLLDLEADGEARVEARHRLLKDHRHVLADDPPPLPRRQVEDVAAVEDDASRR